ncbi:MAG: glycosyltransferase [Candidatus Gracilibacteria bacterium]|nr:glycosyltransferase [Candidatus Gracilibacteria bacterium]
MVVKSFDENIKVVKNLKNMGKGFSIKNGILESNGEYILFIDADNSTPIDNFGKLEKYIEKYDVVIGSRHLEDSEIMIKQPWYRRIVGKLGNKLINLILIKGIKDTQCGFKLFKHNCANDIFESQKIKRWGFDMEILFISKIRGYSIKEVPVSWLNSDGSRLHPIKDSIKTLIELLYIKLNYWFDGYNK